MAITTLVICCPGGYNTGMFELFRPTVCRALLLVLASAVPLYGQPAEPEQEDGFVGVLLSQQAIDLASRFEGRLREVNVRIGDAVRLGAIVARIDDSEIRRELERAQADLDEAQAGSEQAAKQLSMAVDTLTSLQQEPTLVARDEIKRAGDEKELAEAGVQQAEARVRQHEALLGQLEERRSGSEIRAPFDGTVSMRYLDPGQLVNQNTAVIRLISDHELMVRFAVPPEDSARLASGKRVLVSVPVIELIIEGTISQISSEIDIPSGLIFCEAIVSPPENWNGPPLPGRAVRVSLSQE
jgi:RND family efflux transporter MFP subunit